MIPATSTQPGPFFGAVGLIIERNDRGNVCTDDVENYIDGVGHLLSVTGRDWPVLPEHAVLTISGVEPFAVKAPLARWAETATRYGLLPQLVTSGTWATDSAIAEAEIGRLQGLVNVIVISASDHPDTDGDLAWVEWLVLACRSARIRTCITCNATDDARLLRQLAGLPSVNVNTTMIQVLPSVPVGQAPSMAVRSFRPCATRFALMISSNGPVYPCSRGHGCKHLRLGDLRAEPLESIVARAVANPTLRALWHKGPHHANPVAAVDARYLSECDYHIDRLASEEASAA